MEIPNKNGMIWGETPTIFGNIHIAMKHLRFATILNSMGRASHRHDAVPRRNQSSKTVEEGNAAFDVTPPYSFI